MKLQNYMIRANVRTLYFIANATTIVPLLPNSLYALEHVHITSF